MENVNLMNARKGASPDVKESKTELKTVNFYTVDIAWDGGILVKVCGYVRFQGSSHNYRLSDLSMLVCLMAEEFQHGDMVGVRFSEDGKKVVEMRKVDSCG